MKVVTSFILSGVLFVYFSRVSLTPVSFSWPERKILSDHFARKNIWCLPLFKTLLWLPISITVKGLTNPQKSNTIHSLSLPSQLIASPAVVILFQLHQFHYCSSAFPGKIQWVLWSNVLSACTNPIQVVCLVVFPPSSSLCICHIPAMGSTLITNLITGNRPSLCL